MRCIRFLKRFVQDFYKKNLEMENYSITWVLMSPSRYQGCPAYKSEAVQTDCCIQPLENNIFLAKRIKKYFSSKYRKLHIRFL